MLVSCPDKYIGSASKRLLRIFKGGEHILLPLVPKYHRLLSVPIYLVLSRTLAKLGLYIHMAEDSTSTRNPIIT